MTSKLFRIGNSMVISLPKEMLDALKLSEGDEVSIELDAEHGHILFTPSITKRTDVDAEFAKQVAEFIEEYRPALEALAK